MINAIILRLLMWLPAPLVQETFRGFDTFEERMRKGISSYLLLFLLPLAYIAYLVIRFVYNATLGKRGRTSMREDFRNDALKHEKAGEFVSAAFIYEKNLNDFEKAASLYERGGDFGRAALVYQMLGNADKEKEMYMQTGDLVNAAEISFRQGEPEEAARLYEQAGKKVDAAMSLEHAGRKLAAVRLYREAGEYRKAAVLLQEEGRDKDAADMFAISLSGSTPDASNLDDFYTCGLMFEKAGNKDKASEIFSAIRAVDPDFRDVRERVKDLPPEPTQEESPSVKGRTTLRKIMRGGRIEPKQSMRLWVQILKALSEAHRGGWSFGSLCPEGIVLNADHTVTLLAMTPAEKYRAPETKRGAEPDVRADIYSVGVILFEMLTAIPERAGSQRADELAEDVPEWLDAMLVKCLRKVREDRYQSIEEIFQDLKALSKGK